MRNYGGYAFDFVKAVAGHNKHTSTQFAQDAPAGKLPSVSWVYSDHALSEHPPDTPADRAAGVGNVTKGATWTAAQVDAVVAGGLWEKTAIFTSTTAESSRRRPSASIRVPAALGTFRTGSDPGGSSPKDSSPGAAACSRDLFL